MASIRLGKDAKLYRNTGTYGSPVWDVINNVRDLTLNGDFDEGDATTRGAGGVKQTEPTLLNASIEWEMVEDLADTDYTTLLIAHYGRTMMDLFACSGAFNTTGETFFRSECKMPGWKKTEPLGDVNKIAVTAKPCYSTNATQFGLVP
jgi:hypothetical protein